MKKYIISIMLIFCLFFVTKVEVLGATYDDLFKIDLKSINQGEKVCVYYNESNPYYDRFDYIVLYFNQNKEQGTNAFNVIDYTLQIDTESGEPTYAETINLLVNGKSAADTYLNLDEEIDCSDYFVQLLQLDITTYNAILYGNQQSSQFAADEKYTYDEAATNIVKLNIEVIGEEDPEYELNNCTVNLENENKNIQLGNFHKANGTNQNYFLTTDEGVYACPAQVISGFNFERIKLDTTNFSCSDWKLVYNYDFSYNAGNDTNRYCRYYMVDKDAVTNQEGSEITIEGDYITHYVQSRSASASQVRIINTDGVLKILVDNKEVTISNINHYTGIFIAKDAENYPKYINAVKTENGMIYQFSDELLSNAVYNYIEINALRNLTIQGKELINQTCRSLLGNNFLDFLNNNVFRIIYIAVPILLLVLTTFEFAKVVFVGDKDGIQAAWKKFGKRLIMAVLIFFVPRILILVTNIIGANEVEQCAQTLINAAKSEQNVE